MRRGKYNVDRSRWRKCSHPRTPENTVVSGLNSETCKTCKVMHDAMRYSRSKGRPVQRRASHYRPPKRQVIPQCPMLALVPISDSGRSYTLAPTRKVG